VYISASQAVGLQSKETPLHRYSCMRKGANVIVTRISKHDALPHFDLSFQSRTAEVCLACPTTPCRTKTSYHSLQEPQGALRINTRLPPYLGSEDCLTALLACCRLCVSPSDMAILGFARGSLILNVLVLGLLINFILWCCW
jgi:hypothetical protein